MNSNSLPIAWDISTESSWLRFEPFTRSTNVVVMIALLLAFGFLPAAHGQDSGSISGTITDSSGATVPSAGTDAGATAKIDRVAAGITALIGRPCHTCHR